jgi:hypothetical protein
METCWPWDSNQGHPEYKHNIQKVSLDIYAEHKIALWVHCRAVPLPANGDTRDYELLRLSLMKTSPAFICSTMKKKVVYGGVSKSFRTGRL